MGGLRKTASRIHRAVGKTDPIAWKLVGEKATDATEDFTAKYIWGGPIDPEDPNPALPKVREMPDEEGVAKSRKRNNSRRRASTGRASTILTDGEGLGG
jgi:hypothetical protein